MVNKCIADAVTFSNYFPESKHGL